MPEDATFREGMLPSELETKKVALAPEVCRQFLLRKQYILSQIHLHSSVTAYVRMAMRSMLFIVQEVKVDVSGMRIQGAIAHYGTCLAITSSGARMDQRAVGPYNCTRIPPIPG